MEYLDKIISSWPKSPLIALYGKEGRIAAKVRDKILDSTLIELQKLCDKIPKQCSNVNFWKVLYSVQFADLYDIIAPAIEAEFDIQTEDSRSVRKKNIWRDVYYDSLAIASTPSSLKIVESLANRERIEIDERAKELMMSHKTLFALLGTTNSAARNAVLTVYPKLGYAGSDSLINYIEQLIVNGELRRASLYLSIVKNYLVPLEENPQLKSVTRRLIPRDDDEIFPEWVVKETSSIKKHLVRLFELLVYIITLEKDEYTFLIGEMSEVLAPYIRFGKRTGMWHIGEVRTEPTKQLAGALAKHGSVRTLQAIVENADPHAKQGLLSEIEELPRNKELRELLLRENKPVFLDALALTTDMSIIDEYAQYIDKELLSKASKARNYQPFNAYLSREIGKEADELLKTLSSRFPSLITDEKAASLKRGLVGVSLNRPYW